MIHIREVYRGIVTISSAKSKNGVPVPSTPSWSIAMSTHISTITTQTTVRIGSGTAKALRTVRALPHA